MAERRCEDPHCNKVMAAGEIRQTDPDTGLLVCPSCLNNPNRSQMSATASMVALAHDGGDGRVINHCPFCFGGETEYLTRDGVRTFAETVGTIQMVLTADENDRTGGRWVPAEIREFGTQPLLAVTVQRNRQTKVIYATPEHRWLVKSNRRRQERPQPQRSRKGMPRGTTFDSCVRGHEWTPENTRVKEDGTRDCKACAQLAQPVGGVSRATDVDVLTKDLRPGMRLSSLRHPGLASLGLEMDHAGVRHGVVFGDGSAAKGGKSATLSLWGEKDKQLVDFFPEQRFKAVVTPNGVPGLHTSNGLRSWMKLLPDSEVSDSYLYGWLAGYFAADGSVDATGQATLSSANYDNLVAVRDLALRLGIHTYSIRSRMRKGYGQEPSPIFTLSFVGSTLTEEFFLIESHRDRYRFRDDRYERLGWTVVSVEETDRVEPVYCAVVPGTHTFALADNIWVGNCGSGGVVGGSTGTVECTFCNSHFTVQVQPKHINSPQTVNGQPVHIPGMPDESEIGAPVPGAEPVTGTPPEGEAAPTVPGISDADLEEEMFATAEGHLLDRRSYAQYLAVRAARDEEERQAVLAQIRQANIRHVVAAKAREQMGLDDR